MAAIMLMSISFNYALLNIVKDDDHGVKNEKYHVLGFYIKQFECIIWPYLFEKLLLGSDQPNFAQILVRNLKR